jgi:hypothetical protein
MSRKNIGNVVEDLLEATMLRPQEVEELLTALSKQPVREFCLVCLGSMVEIKGTCFRYGGNEKSWPLHLSLCPKCDGSKSGQSDVARP